MRFGINIPINDAVSRIVFVKPDPNRLKSISWSCVRSAKEDWVGFTGFNTWLSGRVSVKSDSGSWVDVISSPRIGKSSGIILRLMRKIIEEGIDGCAVIIVVPSRRLGRQLYKYALGA